ncbi:MAG: PqqD family protein [Candidatus Dadabacteria bacterium]|nr:PqqD family protein [Candidatus Dadabacteria bacterium]
MAPENGLDEGFFDKVFSQNENIVAGEIFLVPIKGKLAHMNRLFALSPLGTYIWAQINGRRKMETVLQAILNKFEVDGEVAERDCFEFINQLIGAELIVEV